jgi:hypothetical protein
MKQGWWYDSTPDKEIEASFEGGFKVGGKTQGKSKLSGALPL